MADGNSGLLALYATERAALLRFLAARTGDPAEAEDIVQELWVKLQSLDAGPIANGRAYLFRMAQNLVLDRLRERKRREARDRSYTDDATGPLAPGAEPVDPEESAEARLIARDEAQRLAAAIATLPEGAQRVLRLHKIEGLSHGEVAVRLGISRSGVEKHMAVAMTHLRRAFGGLG
ncbi:RNA polymerase sigma factor [Sphingomonas sp. CJ20]